LHHGEKIKKEEMTEVMAGEIKVSFFQKGII
jgi:hypothetical protein